MGDWYLQFSQWLGQLSEPIYRLSQSVNIPILAALFLGLVASTSPCQLSTNVGAISFLSRKIAANEKDGILEEALFFTTGKIMVYSLLGGTVVLLGIGMDTTTKGLLPVIEIVRRLMGPIFILSGLMMLDWIRFRGGFGNTFADWVRQRFAKVTGRKGAFLLGVSFSMAFCPTLFWLFFGILIPLGIRSTGGWFFPAIFAMGTVLPLLTFAYLLSTGSEWTKRYVRNLAKVNRYVTRVAAILFLLIGINDTYLYWFS